jgi:branched-chain amino acid transport system substrate-binding protein
MKKQVLTGIAGGAALLLLLAGCANTGTPSGSSTSSTKKIDLKPLTSISTPADAVLPKGDGQGKCGSGTTIAYIGAETGPNAQLGINIYDGVQLAITQHNKANPGCQVQFVKYDTEGDPTKATGPVTQAVNTAAIVGAIGLPFSGESKATGDIFEQKGLVHITPSATNPDLTKNGWTTFFRALGNDSVQGPAAAKFLTSTLKEKKVYLVQDDSDYGIGLGYYAEGAPFDQQLVAKGFKGAFIGPDGVKDDQFIKLAGNASANAYFTCPCIPGELIPSFESAYSSAFNMDPGTYSIEGYDSATILLAGIDKGNTTRPKLLDWVKNYDADGLSKHYKWDSTGELNAPAVYGYEVKDGKIVPIGVIGK